MDLDIENRFKSIEERLDKQDEEMGTLATKADVQEVLTLLKNFKIGIHISGRIFGFSAKAIMSLGAIAAALIAIFEVTHMFGKDMLAFFFRA